MAELDTNEMARLQVDIPEELKTKAKIRALQNDQTLSQVVEEALRALLEPETAKKGK